MEPSFALDSGGVLEGKIDVERLVEKSQVVAISAKARAQSCHRRQYRQRSLRRLYTIVEIFTEDRIGVLFTITYTLHRLGLSIHVAKISTNVDQVADVFYVTTSAGKKSTIRRG